MRANKGILVLVFLLSFSLVSAADCEFDVAKFAAIDKTDIRNVPLATTLVGNNRGVEFDVDGDITYFQVLDGIVEYDGKEKLADMHYFISADKCTLADIESNRTTYMDAYDDGKLTVTGMTLGSKFRLFFAKILFWIFSLFA